MKLGCNESLTIRSNCMVITSVITLVVLSLYALMQPSAVLFNLSRAGKPVWWLGQ